MAKSLYLDDMMWGLIEVSPALMVPWYLISSYAYYELDRPFLSDAAFDELAKRMKSQWDDIDHVHKGFLDLDILEAGTRPKGYPPVTEGATGVLLQRLTGKI